MRTVVQSVRQIRSAYYGHSGLTKLWKRRKHLINTIPSFVYNPGYNVDIDRYLQPTCMVKRALLSNAAHVDTDVSKAGPLIEYERRIAAGELVDGDACQLGTLMLLQRLYDELVESAGACGLDRYSTSEKSGRSRWLWSRFIPSSSYSPVKGLYLYGGVGTGKTMLMDLFFFQLPCSWRKKRIHFHDLMLNVHSRLQRHKGVTDPLEIVAGEISDEAILLCLDEFMVCQI